MAIAEERYVPYSGIIRGTEGAEPVELRIENATAEPISCIVSLAHWYSERLGQVDAGATLTTTLWHDPDSGVLNLLNATDDRMPIEAIWCGRSEALHATRDRIALPFASGAAPEAMKRICRNGPARKLNCDGSGG